MKSCLSLPDKVIRNKNIFTANSTIAVVSATKRDEDRINDTETRTRQKVDDDAVPCDRSTASSRSKIRTHSPAEVDCVYEQNRVTQPTAAVTRSADCDVIISGSCNWLAGYRQPE